MPPSANFTWNTKEDCLPNYTTKSCSQMRLTKKTKHNFKICIKTFSTINPISPAILDNLKIKIIRNSWKLWKTGSRIRHQQTKQHWANITIRKIRNSKQRLEYWIKTSLKHSMSKRASTSELNHLWTSTDSMRAAFLSLSSPNSAQQVRRTALMDLMHQRHSSKRDTQDRKPKSNNAGSRRICKEGGT